MSFFPDDVMKELIEARTTNREEVIRYYLTVLPPKGVKSILDVGCGITAPYSGILKARCEKYTGFDIRHGEKVDMVGDICDMPFRDKEYEWGWCTETIEHIDPIQQQIALSEIVRVCENVVITFPTPLHESFYGDPSHHEVKLNFDGWINKSTKTGRCIYIKEG